MSCFLLFVPKRDDSRVESPFFHLKCHKTILGRHKTTGWRRGIILGCSKSIVSCHQTTEFCQQHFVRWQNPLEPAKNQNEMEQDNRFLSTNRRELWQKLFDLEPEHRGLQPSMMIGGKSIVIWSKPSVGCYKPFSSWNEPLSFCGV